MKLNLIYAVLLPRGLLQQKKLKLKNNWHTGSMNVSNAQQCVNEEGEHMEERKRRVDTHPPFSREEADLRHILVGRCRLVESQTVKSRSAKITREQLDNATLSVEKRFPKVPINGLQ